MKNGEIIKIYDEIKKKIDLALKNFQIELKENKILFLKFEEGLLPSDVLEKVNIITQNLIGKNYSLSLSLIPLDEDISGLIPIEEEILYSAMADDEKKKKICYYIEKLCENKNDRETLFITDKYLFPKNFSENYKKFLLSIFDELKYKSVIVILDEQRYNRELFCDIERELKDKKIFIKTIHFQDIHDRFWISNLKKGIVMGTSLNGIGGKLCYINTLDENDVELIIKYFEENNLLV